MAKFAVGDKVLVVDYQHTYDGYDHWSAIAEVPYFVEWKCPYNFDIHTVTFVGRHDKFNRYLYVLDGRYIVNEEAIQHLFR